MKIKEFIKKNNLENSFLIGYYGGGNLGDELLLEIMQNLFFEAGYKKIKILYFNLKRFTIYHKDFGFIAIHLKEKYKVLKSFFNSKNIVVGGGGLWGLDFGLKVFIFSFIIFFCRFFLFKKVYFFGVGYYKSTTFLGHIGAFLASVGASHIYARDEESYKNFRRFNKKVSIERDMAFYLSEINLNKYTEDVARIEQDIRIEQPVMVVCFRRFTGKHANDYTKLITEVIEKYQNQRFILSIFEPKDIDPEGYSYISNLKTKLSNVQTITDFQYNPVSVYLFFKKYSTNITLIAPQFHAEIIAYLSGIPFLPLSYDNKNTELLHSLNIEPVYIKTLKLVDIETFLITNNKLIML
ncbi:polysaccharide pyruvyl transferase family protein [Candidatus Nomurabacteria bacterium]|nr:MAG: polysaccharide pyruvyl transferase family protein [Candidatus Nomurabacteria bacterium]